MWPVERLERRHIVASRERLGTLNCFAAMLGLVGV
jgi:hypothetical protein